MHEYQGSWKGEADLVKTHSKHHEHQLVVRDEQQVIIPKFSMKSIQYCLKVPNYGTFLLKS